METLELGSDHMSDVSTVTFTPVRNATEKGPKFLYRLSLAGPLAGLSIVGPVMQDAKSGAFRPKVPSIYGTDAVQADVEVIEVNGREIVAQSETGNAILDRWSESLLTAFLAYRQTHKATQPISFRA